MCQSQIFSGVDISFNARLESLENPVAFQKAVTTSDSTGHLWPTWYDVALRDCSWQQEHVIVLSNSYLFRRIPGGSPRGMVGNWFPSLFVVSHVRSNPRGALRVESLRRQYWYLWLLTVTPLYKRLHSKHMPYLFHAVVIWDHAVVIWDHATDICPIHSRRWLFKAMQQRVSPLSRLHIRIPPALIPLRKSRSYRIFTAVRWRRSYLSRNP